MAIISLPRLAKVVADEVVRTTPRLQVGKVYGDSEGVQWKLVTRDRCPYVTAPERYQAYGTAGAWVYLWRVSNHPEFVLSEWLPERLMIDLLSRGE